MIRTEALPQQTPGWQIEIGVGSGVTVSLMVDETSAKLSDESVTDEVAESDTEIDPLCGLETSTEPPDWFETVESVGAAAVRV